MTDSLVYDASKYDNIHSETYTNTFRELNDLNVKSLIKTLETTGKEHLNNPKLMAALYCFRGKNSFHGWVSSSPLTEHLRQDVLFVRTCADSTALDWNPKYLQDPGIVFACSRRDPSVVLRAPLAWTKDARYVTEFARHNGNCLYYLPTAWRSDPVVMFDCITKQGNSGYLSNVQMNYLSQELKTDRAFMSKLAHQLVSSSDQQSVQYLPKELLGDGAFIEPLCAVYPRTFSYASAELQDDRAFVKRVAQKNPEVLEWASAKIRSDICFLCQCVGGVEQAKEHGLYYLMIGPWATKVKELEALGVHKAIAFERVAQQALVSEEVRALRRAIPAKALLTAKKTKAIGRSL